MPKVWNKRDPNCPKDAVYVGRPTKWGNPFLLDLVDKPYGKIVKHSGTREEAVAKYRSWIDGNLELRRDCKRELKGKDLVCWCKPAACHADILLEIANGE